jgi:hypothetical protein
LNETQQLVFDNDPYAANYTRQFRTDLQRILGLNESLPEIMPRTKPDIFLKAKPAVSPGKMGLSKMV